MTRKKMTKRALKIDEVKKKKNHKEMSETGKKKKKTTTTSTTTNEKSKEVGSEFNRRNVAQ